VQLMNDARLSFAAALDTVARRVALSGPRPIDVAVAHVARSIDGPPRPSASATLAYERSPGGSLHVVGTLGGSSFDAKLVRSDARRFALVRGGRARGPDGR